MLWNDTVGGCGGLDENSTHRFKYLKAWYPVSRTAWERLGSVGFAGGGKVLDACYTVKELTVNELWELHCEV